MYALANTTVTILRGFGSDDYGDDVPSGTAIATGVPAFVSSPSQSPFRPIILGTTVFMSANNVPTVTREILCVLPSGTDITNEDQLVDESTGVTYQIMLVTQQGRIGGLEPDMQLTLRRTTTTQSV